MPDRRARIASTTPSPSPESAPQPGRVLINIGRAGILPDGDTMDLSRADVGAARAAIARHRDIIVGVKARLSRDVAGTNDYEVLRRAQEVVTPFNLPVMIHMGQTMSPLPQLMELLKPGDIVTHMFAPPPNSIVDDSGRILPEVLAARRRGVWFDVGNGRTGHLRWDIVERVHAGGLLAGYVLDRLDVEGRTAQVIDFPNVMSKFLDFGMTLDQVIARATVNASRALRGVPRPRHAQRRRAGRCRGSGAARGLVRVRRQLQEHPHRTAAAVPERDGSRRQADSTPVSAVYHLRHVADRRPMAALRAAVRLCASCRAGAACGSLRFAQRPAGLSGDSPAYFRTR